MTHCMWCLPTHWSLSFRWGTSLVTNWQVLKDSRLQVSSGLSYTTTILKLDTVNYAYQFKIHPKSYDCSQNKVYYYYHSLTFCHNKIPLPPWHHNQLGHRSLLALVYIQSLAGIYIWSEIFLSSQIFSKLLLQFTCFLMLHWSLVTSEHCWLVVYPSVTLTHFWQLQTFSFYNCSVKMMNQILQYSITSLYGL